MDTQVVYIPLDEIKKPKDGKVVVDRWWVHKPGKGVVFIRLAYDLIPQCNREFEIANDIQQKHYPDHDLVLIPTAYLGYLNDG